MIVPDNPLTSLTLAFARMQVRLPQNIDQRSFQ